MFTVYCYTWRDPLRKPLWYACLLAALATPLITACSTGTENPTTNSQVAADEHSHDHGEEAGHSHEDGHAHEEGEAHEDDHAHKDEHEAAASEVPAGTVAIPPQVRQNLGITFAAVEMRRVASTMRVPGKFEPLPSAVREYHAPLAGRVELLVSQYEKVTTGSPLYRLNSSQWRSMQQELLSAHAQVLSTSASLMTAQIARSGGASAKDVRQQRIASSEAHIANLRQSIKVAEDRLAQVEKLQNIMGGKLSELNEARAQISSLRSELSKAQEDRSALEQQQLQLATEGSAGAFGTQATLHATLLAREAEYASAKAQRDLLYASLVSIIGRENLEPGSTAATWTLIPEITVNAVAEGTVSEVSLSTGAYVDSATQVMTTLNTERLRFRAMALQSDVQRLNGEMHGRILEPGTGDGSGRFIPVVVAPGLEADAEERTLDLIAEVDAIYPWAKIGLSTDLELVLNDTEDPEPAIPVEAVIQDGLDKIFFRRDPQNPDHAVRVEADLGVTNGQWVAVLSGVKAGDEVVLDGVYELKLATADAPEKAGHFHADGTFHEGED